MYYIKSHALLPMGLFYYKGYSKECSSWINQVATFLVAVFPSFHKKTSEIST